MTALTVSFFTYGVTTVISVMVSGIVWFMGKVFAKLSRHVPAQEFHAHAGQAHTAGIPAAHDAEIAAAISAAIIASRS